MQYKEITCPSCSSLNIRKNGKTANQKQRYQCGDCRKQFLTNYTYRGCQPEVRALIVRMTMNSAGSRDIARVLLISPNTVRAHLRAASAKVSEPAVPTRIRDLEVDEFGSFVRTKAQPRWTWYAWDRQRKKIVAFVHGRRMDKSCQQLVRKLSAARVGTFHTDDGQSYRKYLPSTKHQVGKAGTLRIERQNLNFRTHTKRLQRRTICFSKTEEMHDTVLKLYIHHSNMDDHQM